MIPETFTPPASPVRSGDPVADIVADVVAATRRGTAVFARSRLHAPWGVSVPAGAIASVHVVTTGACWLLPDGGDPVHLARGDVVLVPSGVGHTLVDSPGRPVRPLAELAAAVGDSPPGPLTLDGDGPVTGLLCGGYLLDPGLRHPLTTMVPQVMHVAAGQARGTGLAAAVELLSAEVDRTDPGTPAVVTSLVDLLFVYILRAWLAERRHASDGWAQVVHDPVVGGALALVHGDPARAWTVALLARSVGVSRATFSRRFTELTGQSPMAYVTSWRMMVAARLLREHRAPLREVARDVGYDSEFAFARAFKRLVGQAPGHYRGHDDPPALAWSLPPAGP